jgi:hypothetical protein
MAPPQRWIDGWMTGGKKNAIAFFLCRTGDNVDGGRDETRRRYLTATLDQCGDVAGADDADDAVAADAGGMLVGCCRFAHRNVDESIERGVVDRCCWGGGGSLFSRLNNTIINVGEMMYCCKELRSEGDGMYTTKSSLLSLVRPAISSKRRRYVCMSFCGGHADSRGRFRPVKRSNDCFLLCV